MTMNKLLLDVNILRMFLSDREGDKCQCRNHKFIKDKKLKDGYSANYWNFILFDKEKYIPERLVRKNILRNS